MWKVAFVGRLFFFSCPLSKNMEELERKGEARVQGKTSHSSFFAFWMKYLFFLWGPCNTPNRWLCRTDSRPGPRLLYNQCGPSLRVWAVYSAMRSWRISRPTESVRRLQLRRVAVAVHDRRMRVRRVRFLSWSTKCNRTTFLIMSIPVIWAYQNRESPCISLPSGWAVLWGNRRCWLNEWTMW